MVKKWASHEDFGDDPVKHVEAEPAPDMDTHGRAWYVPELDRYVVFGVHLFDTEEEARASEDVEWSRTVLVRRRREPDDGAPQVRERRAASKN